MDNEPFLCDRCGARIEGAYANLQLFESPNLEEHGQFTETLAPEIICCDCADALSPTLERCNFNCLDCKAVSEWNINTKSCLNLQRELGLISDDDAEILEFVKPWILVNLGRDIGAEVLWIKHEITEQRRLRIQE